MALGGEVGRVDERVLGWSCLLASYSNRNEAAVEGSGAKRGRKTSSTRGLLHALCRTVFSVYAVGRDMIRR